MQRNDRQAPSTVANGRLDSLDGLRAIAVIGIVLYHLRLPIAPGGSFGVICFLVLGGYLLTCSMMRSV
ncbi:MAG: hypothetical protein IJH87_02820, partial [Atopobiaceae bacterium]|nr:hypothetical protein [Atopobiaceae bacterium]